MPKRPEVPTKAPSKAPSKAPTKGAAPVKGAPSKAAPAPAPSKAPVRNVPGKGATAPATNQPKAVAPRKAPQAPAAPATPAKGPVRKSPLVEKVKSFLNTVEPKLADKICELEERPVADGDGGKQDVVFISFSPGGEKDDAVDDAYNVSKIKEVLFAYHTAPEKAATGKSMMVEVLPPAEKGVAHYLALHEE